MSTVPRSISWLSSALCLFALSCAAAAQDTCSTTLLINAFSQSKGRPQALPVVGVRARVNGKPAPVNAIRPLNRPLHLMVVIDASGSMTYGGNTSAPVIDMSKRKWHMTIDLARKIVGNVPNDSDVGLLMFWDHEVNSLPLTKDRAVLFAELERYQTSGGFGKTALWDSIARANTMFPPSSARNIMVVISDGGDNISHLGKPALQKELAKTGTRVFSLALFEPYVTNEERAGAADLVELAENRGGIALTLDSQTLLANKPPEQDQTLSAMAAVLNDFATNSYEIELNTNAVAKIEDLVLRTDPKSLPLAYPRAILPCSGHE